MQAIMEPIQNTQRIVQSAQRGDRDAFSTLAEIHRGQVEALARLRMSPRLQRKVGIEDVVQETFAQALESLGRFQWAGEDSFGRWLNGIARNVILKAARTHSIPLQSGFEWDVAESGPSPSTVLRREERFDRLREALEALTPEQREVVLLSRIEGLKAKEIAARTGRSEDSVKQLMLRALRGLRRDFGDTESLHLPDRSLESGETSHGSSHGGEPA